MSSSLAPTIQVEHTDQPSVQQQDQECLNDSAHFQQIEARVFKIGGDTVSSLAAPYKGSVDPAAVCRSWTKIQTGESTGTGSINSEAKQMFSWRLKRRGNYPDGPNAPLKDGFE